MGVWNYQSLPIYGDCLILPTFLTFLLVSSVEIYHAKTAQVLKSANFKSLGEKVVKSKVATKKWPQKILGL